MAKVEKEAKVVTPARKVEEMMLVEETKQEEMKLLGTKLVETRIRLVDDGGM